MKKVVLDDLDFALLHDYACYKTKQEVLQDFEKNYNFDEHVDSDWFESEEVYEAVVNAICNRDRRARKLIAKLNQMSEKEWNKHYGQK